MKGRPNNIVKNIVRSKSPPIAPSRPQPNIPKPRDKNGSLSQTNLVMHSSQELKFKTTAREEPNNQKKYDNKIAQVKESNFRVAESANRCVKIEKNGKTVKDEDDNTTEQSSSQHISYVAGEYQLDSYELFARRKNVKFQEKVQQLQKGEKQRESVGKSSSRNSSILKNSTRVLDRSVAASSEKSLSIQNSFTAVKKCKIGFTTIQQNSSNNVTHKKYQNLLQQFKAKAINNGGQIRQKYIDDLFPPVEASIFSNSVYKKINLSKTKDEIVWLRITQLYPPKTLRIYNKAGKNSNMIMRSERSYSEPYLQVCFNAIKNNTVLLGQMFESDQINPYGIYLVKIYQDSAWKYVIVDDLIPCIKRRQRTRKQQRYQPAFMNVQAVNGETVNIWPFLIEKAFANYYSCYENLCFGNSLDFLSELTGTPYTELCLSPKKNSKVSVQKNLATFSNQLCSNQSSISIGWSEQKHCYFSLYVLRDSYTTQNPLLAYSDPQTNDINTIQLNQLSSIFSSVYLYRYNLYPNSTTCPVYPPKNIKQRPRKKSDKSKYIEIPPNDTTSLRSFTIFKTTNCCLDIRQKENRFYYQCGISEYPWMRCILLQKQYDGGFRWISGKYTNQKHIIFQQKLDPGEYNLMIMVQWRERYNKQITILLFSDCDFIKFERKNYNRDQRILQLSCMDLAQRYGKLSQINKSICAYTYLCQDSALIIENINNQRTKGEVTIMRSINGLKSKVDILPLNLEFEADLPEEYGALEKTQRRVIGQSIQIDIQKGESFTVVLRMRGGIDRKFFKAFNFG